MPIKRILRLGYSTLKELLAERWRRNYTYTRPEPTPASSTSTERPPQRPERVPEDVDAAPHFDLEEMVTGLGLGLRDATVITREALSFELNDTILALDVSDADDRAWLFDELFALRVALDAQLCAWTPGREREDDPDVYYQKQEVPSVYGDRMPRALSHRCIERIEELTDKELLVTPLGSSTSLVYLLEVGRYYHVMSIEEAATTAQGADKIIEHARHALFYQSYKVRPSERRESSAGPVRIYETGEGLGATRCALMPDFDHDAARKHGWAALCSRDVMIVAEPVTSLDSRAAHDECARIATALRDAALYPLPIEMFELTIQEATPEQE